MEKGMFDSARHKWILFFTVSFSGLFFDWYTKYLAITKLQMGIQVPVIGRILQWQLIYNKGGIFGFNPRVWISSFPINPFFYVLSVIAMVLIIIYYKNIEPGAKFSLWGISFIMPGALGNLLDRIIRPGQGVVDFIRVDLGFPPFNPWPIWNLADAYITIGVSLIVIDLWLQEIRKKRTKGDNS
jgi:signal peptidase II